MRARVVVLSGLFCVRDDLARAIAPGDRELHEVPAPGARST